MESESSILPEWILSAETQAAIIVGLCCVGAWVILHSIMQIMFSILWPFFLAAAVMIALPSLRRKIAKDFLPQQMKMMKKLRNRFATAVVNQTVGSLNRTSGGAQQYNPFDNWQDNVEEASVSIKCRRDWTSICNAIYTQRKADKPDLYKSVLSQTQTEANKEKMEE